MSKEYNEFHGKGRRLWNFVEANGQFILANPSMLALRQAQDAFAGFAEENDLQTDEDVVALVKGIRAERGR